MSAAPLPADPSLWPPDPHAILGAPPGADAAALHRACEERLAAFPAEQFPEQHRRICEAFSAALRQLDLDRLLEGAPALGAAPAPAPPASPPAPAPSADLTEELDGLWQQALAGEEEPAYRQLVAVRRACLDRADVYLRLYWLLKTTPALDSERSAADWLTEGLRTTGFAEPLWELYRREVAVRPEAAVDVSSTDLLDSPLPVSQLARLAECRWRAAGRLEQWELIGRDLDALRDRVQPTEGPTWVQLLGAAACELIWGPAAVCGPRLAALREEMERLAANPPRMSPEKLGAWQIRLEQTRDALDALGCLAAACRALDTDHWAKVGLARLVPMSWSRPPEEYRPALLAYVEELITRPEEALAGLDAAGKQAPAVLGYFAELLESLQASQGPPADPRPSHAITDVVLDFLDGCERPDYRTLRPELLAFCLREAIRPQQVALVARDRPEYALSEEMHLAEMIAEDQPLALVWQAHALFWA